MLSISGAMSPGDGLTHYFTGNEDYYLSSPGQWQGLGAAALGLTGTVQRDQFELVSNGFDPSTGKLLVSGKEVTDRDGKTSVKKQAGNDLTFSADKSVSIASIVDPRIKELHEKSVERIVAYIEKNNIQARRQINGNRTVVDTGNLVTAKFTHNTSRELDPQLHTHVFLFNMTRRQDGQWRALHNRSLFQDKMALGRLYRNEFVKELSEAGYNIEITDRKDGYFRVRGVPEQLEDHFSKRRQQIEARVKNPSFRQKYPNADRATLYQIAALGTRRQKQQLSAKDIRDHWRKEIEGQGYTVEKIKAGIEQHKIKIHPQKTAQQKTPETSSLIEQAASKLTETESVFSKAAILKAAATIDFGKYLLDELDRTFISTTSIEKMNRENGRQFYTTKEMRKVEQTVIRTAQNGKGKRQPLATMEEVKKTIAEAEQQNGWQYTPGQREAIAALATARDNVLLIQGDAGTGKTAAMSVFRSLADSKGYTVQGLGFTGKAADELQQGAGIRSRTIDSFLLDQEQGGQPGKEVWLVDESSMAGARHYAALLEKAEKQDTTVIFMGDVKQFQSIAAGRMFQDLQAAVGTHARLTEVMRQKTPEIRAVVSALNRGRPDHAVDMLDRQGNLKEYKSKNDLHRAAVQQYKNAAKNGTKNTVVIASTNKDRQILNKKIKAELVKAGAVEQGTDHTVLSPHNVSAEKAGLASSYEEGQIIQANRAIPRLKAGQFGQVVGIDHHRNILTVQIGSTKQIIDIGREHSRLSVYNQETVNLSQGDRIIFGKNDKKLGIKNGQIGTMKAIDSNGNVSVKTGKKIVRFSLREKQPGDPRLTYKHIDHAYAITAHKSQGATMDNVIWYAPTKKGQDRQLDRRSAYVAATRAKEGFTVLTDDKKALRNAVTKEQDKKSTLSFDRKYKLEKIKTQIKAREKETKSHIPRVEMTMGH